MNIHFLARVRPHELKPMGGRAVIHDEGKIVQQDLVQRRVAVRVAGVDLGPFVHQQGRGRKMALAHRDLKRRQAQFVARLDEVGCLGQCVEHAYIAGGGGFVNGKRGSAFGMSFKNKRMVPGCLA